MRRGFIDTTPEFWALFLRSFSLFLALALVIRPPHGCVIFSVLLPRVASARLLLLLLLLFLSFSLLFFAASARSLSLPPPFRPVRSDFFAEFNVMCTISIFAGESVDEKSVGEIGNDQR